MGVDVFFVISGYVVTNSIAADVREKRFTYLGFYEKRIRRLLPGILIVSAFCLIMAWAFEFENEFRSIAKDIFFCVTFMVNFRFARQTGYFDTASSPSPLLHFWSLAVEEQFYFIWPALLLFLLKFSGPARVRIALAACGISLAACAILSRDYGLFAFYMLPTRMWEFLFGALVVLCPRRLGRIHFRASLIEAAAITGTAGLVASCIILTGDSTYPGFNALLPVGSTVLLVLAHNSAFNRQLLSSRAVVWVGRRSYQIYLWHWPLLIYYPSVFNEQPTTIIRVVLLAVTVLTAHLTYSAEVPLRALRGLQLRRAVFACIASSVLVAVISAAAAKGVLKERLPALAGVVGDLIYLSEIEILNPGKSESVLFLETATCSNSIQECAI